MRDELRDGDDGSVAWTLLFGLASSEPGTGEDLDVLAPRFPGQ